MMTYDKRVVMNVNGMRCALNMPKASKVEKDENGNEKQLGLPPYAPRFVFPVDEYPAAPATWMHGSALASSYFVPVRVDHAMWLDFNYLAEDDYDVACVISVQGINPVTGQKTKELRLEQYVIKCPVHDEEFKQDRFCDKCGYKWDSQNYLATTGTPKGLLWLDGFRAVDGVVRQYMFTEEVRQGVAAQVIGDDRVFAIGVAFYRSKEKKKALQPVVRDWNYYGGKAGGMGGAQLNYASVQHMNSGKMYRNVARGGVAHDQSYGGLECLKSVSAMSTPTAPPRERDEKTCGGFESVMDFDGSASLDMYYPTQIGADGVERSLEVSKGSVLNGFPPSNTISPSVRITDEDLCFMPKEIETKNLEIGAGARIGQQIYRDPQPLDYWQEKPVGMIYINYVSLEDAEKIVSAGKKDLTANGDGYLDQLAKIGG